MPLLILLILMLVLPQGREVINAVKRFTPVRWTVPWRIQVAALVVLAAFLVSVPQWAGYHLGSWTAMLTYVLLFLALGLLVRTTGLVCLCVVTFEAIGVVAFSKLVDSAGLPWLVAIVLAGLVTAVVAALVAIPAVRLSGVFVAVATFGFGLLVQQMFYQTNVMFGTQDVGLPAPRPQLSWIDVSSTKGYYYAVLIIVGVCCVAIIGMVRTRLGRLLRALNDSPRTLATSGANVTVLNVLVFCIAGFFAGVAGTLFAVYLTAPSGLDFDPFASLSFIALVVIAVGVEPWYALGAAAGYVLLQSYWNPSGLSNYLELLFGLSAIWVAVSPQSSPTLLTARARDFLDRVGARRASIPVPAAAAAVASRSTMPVPVSSNHVAEPKGVLEVQGVRVAFGGLVAVNKLSLRTEPGSIRGLIGPNGAGKSTTFNACCGLVRPTDGHVLLDGHNISRLGPSGRALRGLGRTFQDIGLWDSLTVAQNVAMGREAVLAGGNVVKQLVGSPSDRRAITTATAGAMELCGLNHLANEVVGTLSTGQRRLVEFARCLAGSSNVILLDEPSSGLDQEETDQFARMLEEAVRERNLSVLLVEHDMRLVMGVCSYVYVMDAGTLIFEGTPSEARNSSAVRTAYFGEDIDSVGLEPAVQR